MWIEKWIIHRMQEGPAFERKNVPRGTLLWNGNPQDLVFVDNFFYSLCDPCPRVFV